MSRTIKEMIRCLKYVTIVEKGITAGLALAVKVQRNLDESFACTSRVKRWLVSKPLA
jgi:hypothetical protein